MKDLNFKQLFKTAVKRTHLYLVFTLLVVSSCSTNISSITGDISGVDSDSLLFIVTDMNTGDRLYTDTVALKHNHFDVQLPDSALYVFMFVQPKNPNVALRVLTDGPILYFPGDQIKIEGSIDDFQIMGSELYDGLATNTEIITLEKKVHALNNAFTEAYRANNKMKLDSIRIQVRTAFNKLQKAKLEFIRTNPSAISSAYYATKMKAEMGLEAISLLSEDVMKSQMGLLVNKARESYENTIARSKARENIKQGKPAPDLKLSTSDDKIIYLSSFKGKYLLIDFWGSWCGWCIKGFPEMKKYYEKYHTNVEFLGISCNDSEKKWRKALETYKLPWINVMEGKSKASVIYAVSGFPTKILVNPNGEIAEIFVGESPELYKKLDELFCK